MNTPKIRFKGFTDAWEQRKLSEICERITRKNRNNESDLPLTIASQFGLIDQRDFFNKVVAAKDMSNYYLLKKGEFAYNKSYSNGFDYGSIKRLNAYKQGCLSTLYICFGITSDEVESDYLECFFDTLKWYGDLSMICAEGARNHGLLNVDTKGFFDEVTVDLPKSLEEQKRISVYMNALNRLITLHQRKCDETKELKKFMLQKMFPKNGEKNPEIRFEGFTDDWEQRKLEELGTVQTCKRIFKEQTSEKGDIPFFKNGTIGLEPDSYISREMYEEFRRLYPYPEVGDTLISVVGSIGRTAEYTGKDEYFQDSNVVWLKTDGSINKKFLKISYQVIKWLIEGSTVKHLYNDNILRSEIVMPVSQIEQAKIADFFEELDHLITLHQRKCEKLKELKKFMLQNMFV